MQNAVTHGEARVRVSIDATGKLLDALVLAYTHREFGDEALRAVKAWRYEPGLENGEPIGVVGDVTFAFEASGTVAVVNQSPLKDGEISPAKAAMAYGAESSRTSIAFRRNSRTWPSPFIRRSGPTAASPVPPPWNSTSTKPAGRASPSSSRPIIRCSVAPPPRR